MIPPIMFLLVNARPIIISPIEYLYVFVPYITFSMLHFFGNMWRRGQSIKNLLLAQSLAFITFPVYISSVARVMTGRKMDFIKTPKGNTGALPFKSLLPQIFMLALNSIAAGKGLGMAYLALSMHWWERFTEVAMNVLWTSFHLLLLFHILKFRKPKRRGNH
jgi:hypothetical protein